MLLKPCPFCGSDTITTVENGDDYAWAECADCLADGPMMSDDPDCTKAMEAWNKRVEERR